MTRKSTNGESQDVAQPLQMCFGGFRKVTSLPHPSITKSCNIYHLQLWFTHYQITLSTAGWNPTELPRNMGSWWIHCPLNNQPWPHKKPGQLTILSLRAGWGGCIRKEEQVKNREILPASSNIQFRNLLSQIFFPHDFLTPFWALLHFRHSQCPTQPWGWSSHSHHCREKSEQCLGARNSFWFFSDTAHMVPDKLPPCI